MQKNELLAHLSVCVEKGKADKATPTPPEMKDQEGAQEITAQLIEMDVAPEEILNGALIPGMKRIGDLYGEGKAFVPHLLLAAREKPGESNRRGLRLGSHRPWNGRICSRLYKGNRGSPQCTRGTFCADHHHHGAHGTDCTKYQGEISRQKNSDWRSARYPGVL